jgi:hypothetical protein
MSNDNDMKRIWKEAVLALSEKVTWNHYSNRYLAKPETSSQKGCSELNLEPGIVEYRAAGLFI